MHRHEEIEVGRRVARGLVMENGGSPQRRSRWIVGTAVVAFATGLRGR